MSAALILTNVAILLLAASHWDTLKAAGGVTPARRTYLTVASIFALVSAVLQIVNR